MQIVVLILLAAGFSIAGVVFLQIQFEPLDRRDRLIDALIGFLFALAGTAVFEAVLKAGRPTLVYYFRPLGPAALKIFVGGAFLGVSAWILVQSMRLVLIQKRAPSRSVPAFMLRTLAGSLLIAACLELFVFNIRHYENFTLSDRSTVTLERGDFTPYGFYFNRASQRYTSYAPYDQPYRLTVYFDPIKVRNLRLEYKSDRPITNVYLRVNDEAFELADQDHPVRLVPDIPRSLILPLHTIGKSYRIDLIFPQATEESEFSFELNRVQLNVTVPLEFSIPRLAVAWIVLWLILILRPGSVLWNQALNPKSRGQFGFSAVLTGIVILFMIWTVTSNYAGRVDLSHGIKSTINQINVLKKSANPTYSICHEQTEALLSGRLHLGITPDTSLLSAERPYDITYRDRYRVRYLWDHAYFNRRYYAYFGIVPVLNLFLPIRALSGIDLPVDFAALIYAITATIGLFVLVRRIMLDYFPSAPFALYLISALAVTAAANPAWALRRGLVYELAIQSGVAFSVWGLNFALILRRRIMDQGGKRPNFIPPVLALLSGSCAALAVGCRPTMVFIFIWILTVPSLGSGLFSRENRAAFVRGLVCFAVPVVIAALGIMRYNRLRFGSIFEFGFRFQLSFPNESVAPFRISFSGAVLSILSYLFQGIELSYDFPFAAPARMPALPYLGYIQHEETMAGIAAFPWLWGLILLIPVWRRLRGKRLTLWIGAGLICAGLLLGADATVAVLFRYLLDFSWILALIACCAWLALAEENRRYDGAIFAAAAAAVALGALLSLNGDRNWLAEFNPLQFERLRYLFCFWI